MTIIIPMKGASSKKGSRSSPVKGGARGGSVESPCRQSIIENGKPELDRTPLEGEQLEKLYQLTKLAEETVDWTEEQ